MSKFPCQLYLLMYAQNILSDFHMCDFRLFKYLFYSVIEFTIA